MKTATVRDLRNHFADLAKWIESGEKISITRNGAAFALLSPVSRSSARPKGSWAARNARYQPVGRKLTKEQTELFWSKLRD